MYGTSPLEKHHFFLPDTGARHPLYMTPLPAPNKFMLALSPRKYRAFSNIDFLNKLLAAPSLALWNLMLRSGRLQNSKTLKPEIAGEGAGKSAAKIRGAGRSAAEGAARGAFLGKE